MQHFPFLMLAQATGGGRGVGGGEGSNAAVIFLHLLLFLIKHSFSSDNGFGFLSVGGCMGGPVGAFTDRPSPVKDNRICFSKIFNN